MCIASVRWLAMLSAATLASASCDKKTPTRPESVPAASDAFVTLRLTAPARVNPGESVQLTAEAVKADGSAENVTGQASWSSTDASVVQVSASGFVTTRGRGESIVRVRYRDKVAQAHIFVMPADTFRLAGSIKESGVGIGGVAVRILAGTGQGLVTQSAEDGSYAVYGVNGSVRIQLTKAGYLDRVQDVDVTEHRSQDFELLPERARTDFAGTYTVTITAQPSCSGISPGSFPEVAKRREYTATVTQDGRRVAVTLSGGDFVITGGRGNMFVGDLDISNVLRFNIGSPNFGFYGPWYYGLPEVAERVDGTTLIVSAVVVVGTPPRLSGRLQGYLIASDRPSHPFGPPYTSICVGDHGFEMVRR